MTEPTGGSTFTRTLGPLPLWAWMGIGLGGLLAYSSWKKDKAAATAQSTGQTVPSTSVANNSTDAGLIPQFVNQVYENPEPPVINVNPTTPVNVSTPVTVNNPAPATPPPTPPPPPPSAPPPPPPPAGQWVTVGVWNSTNAPWNSTLWGIAQHFYGNGALYPKIFAANRTGVIRPDGTAGQINNPNLIYPNERIWVPA